MIRFLHTNDLHGRLTSANCAPLASARLRSDLYFDTGDCIKTGNLGIPLSQEPVWNLLADLDCSASTIGNRETHILEGAFQSKIKGLRHPLLCGNLRRRDGSFPLQRSLIVEAKGLRVGILAVSVAMVTTKMKTQAASAFLWDQPIETAINLALELRPEVDLVIALTHIGFNCDKKLAESTENIDIIFGGHSHTVLEQPIQVGKAWIAQGGSHAHYFGEYEWSDGVLNGGLVPWSS